MNRKNLPVLAAVFPAIFLSAVPASATTASDDDVLNTYVDCPLERIGSQLVRCDNLTGLGLDAPDWIPEQR
ncbi:hypothetical protein LFT44_15405 [Arthrobacter sp. FW306-05-C]|uniref:hypothetical protein n=1 Tax=Arthrobacter TaxID=1663 RepID=UPI001EF15511|nr:MULTISPECIES: hypothetical protein [Arthrobacter]MDP9986427.1 hypothetical protein [Arthrobacter oryzae]UKA65879.1 hypothetical protein LFT44_15405 [Arthrobacter sp. FW306-05-C]UKA70240.1 hypothetical protein LFT49_16060 [Arthrobacter sp. FW306-06-A]UKA74541.1 hypothetical protein LFT46_15435 [Arthrobacter sp. FW306-07-I]